MSRCARVVALASRHVGSRHLDCGASGGVDRGDPACDLSEVTGSLAERLLASPSGPRVVPLELARGYRDAAAEQLSVALARYVRCAPCSRKGCERCGYVGWRVVESTADVLVPHGATTGTRVTVEGVGDEIDGIARPIVVEIVEAGPRAAELRDAQADFEGKLETAWQMERAAHGRRRRRTHVMVGAAIALLLLIPIGRYIAKSSTGERCSNDDECRSSHCIRLMTVPPYPLSTRLDGQVCTASCVTDLDCPSPMTCRARTAEGSSQIALDVPDGLACIPSGY